MMIYLICCTAADDDGALQVPNRTLVLIYRFEPVKNGGKGRHNFPSPPTRPIAHHATGRFSSRSSHSAGVQLIQLNIYRGEVGAEVVPFLE